MLWHILPGIKFAFVKKDNNAAGHRLQRPVDHQDMVFKYVIAGHGLTTHSHIKCIVGIYDYDF